MYLHLLCFRYDLGNDLFLKIISFFPMIEIHKKNWSYLNTLSCMVFVIDLVLIKCFPIPVDWMDFFFK